MLSSSHLYRGKIINVRMDRVRIYGGEEQMREVVEHPGAVAILAVNDKEEVILVRQHRRPAGETMLEIPAGKLEPGEDPLNCARRELLEETGLQGKEWTALFSYYPSPGFCNEIIYLFMAGNLSPASSPTHDPEEKITVTSWSLKEAFAMIGKGEIRDGKTIIALQYAMLFRG